MWRCLPVRVFRRQRLSVCGFSTGSNLAPVRLYVVAGEASGDAIGAKVIRALQRHQPPRSLEIRGIGGPLMSKAGAFESLFPMQELSVMGLLEVVPHIWRFQRRIHDTLRDIENYQPELILTIDSKGFTFRVLKALQASEQKSGGKRIKKVHYVAPSVWAYKHRGKRDFTELKQLLDAMFTILPFEEDIFNAGEEIQSPDNKGRTWCHFVGHPAVEDFLEINGVYESVALTGNRRHQSPGTTSPGVTLLIFYETDTCRTGGKYFYISDVADAIGTHTLDTPQAIRSFMFGKMITMRVDRLSS
ncbi:hypothetical protein PPTG_01267 [Phytophthora nicotianae INRA-310]|uniref:lipid-A-disaccharide synthase n=1 Tax=Phytophthora nicotianae (strain INRA-310) TaxID=761204 RepID=W2R8Q4_PHYN3|nr:hypothetical protein PPTG_01267 [Phytophthora nicotianae INRA-310]ETN20900.1 hypothetical protein PPTG_01267 [Phytophthora nicotianae INRA-310]